MTVYSYTGNQLAKRTQPKKPFWSGNKIAVAVACGSITLFGVAVATTSPIPQQPVTAQPSPKPVQKQVPVKQPEKTLHKSQEASLEPNPAVEESAPKTEMKYSRSGALVEMCEAGRQYRGDVMSGAATHRQAMNEVYAYASYLSGLSPASYNELVKSGTDGLWMDRC